MAPRLQCPRTSKRSDLFRGRIYRQTAQLSTDGAVWLYNHDLKPREKHDSFGGSKRRPGTAQFYTRKKRNRQNSAVSFPRDGNCRP